MIDPAMLQQLMGALDASGRLGGMGMPFGFATPGGMGPAGPKGPIQTSPQSSLFATPGGMGPAGPKGPIQTSPQSSLFAQLGSRARGPMPGNNPAGLGFNRGTMAKPQMGQLGRKPIMGRPMKKPSLQRAGGLTVADAFRG
jgi:hypothetical protein